MAEDDGLVPGKVALTGESHRGQAIFLEETQNSRACTQACPGFLPPSLASPLPITPLGTEHPSLRSALGSHQ